MRHKLPVLGLLLVAGCAADGLPYVDNPGLDAGVLDLARRPVDFSGHLVDSGLGFPDARPLDFSPPPPPPLDFSQPPPPPPLDFSQPPGPDFPSPIDLYLPPIDAGVRDFYVPPIDTGLRDLSQPPVDARLPDLYVYPVDSFPPPIDARPSDLFFVDSGIPVDAGSSCRQGQYSGPWSGAINGLMVTGTITFVLGPPQNNVLSVVNGFFVGSGPANAAVSATVTGALDCGRQTFSGNLTNGSVVVFNMNIAWTGALTAFYDVFSQSFLKGLWTFQSINGGQFTGNGTWTAQ